ncbi:MAG: hypothetical protein EAZ92_06785 [Candidatus Kapaibacterium sp.]|nr:MAG: hypothetical protein EAZ92_06785 [Candidatus Kapabacteria bacterium]
MPDSALEQLPLRPVSPPRAVVPLKGFQAFDAVFRHGARFAYRGVTAFVLFDDVLAKAQKSSPDDHALQHISANYQQHSSVITGNDTLSHALLVGVSAKRRTRPAVMRNRIKRLLRTSIHQTIQREGQLSRGIAAMVLICNIIPEKPSLLVLDEIAPLVGRIVQNADKYYSSRHGNSNAAKEKL